MFELFFLIMQAGKGKKAHKEEPALYFCVSSKRDLSYEGSFMVECWLWEEQWLHLLEGVHILLCK